MLSKDLNRNSSTLRAIMIIIVASAVQARTVIAVVADFDNTMLQTQIGVAKDCIAILKAINDELGKQVFPDIDKDTYKQADDKLAAIRNNMTVGNIVKNNRTCPVSVVNKIARTVKMTTAGLRNYALVDVYKDDDVFSKSADEKFISFVKSVKTLLDELKNINRGYITDELYNKIDNASKDYKTWKKAAERFITPRILKELKDKLMEACKEAMHLTKVYRDDEVSALRIDVDAKLLIFKTAISLFNPTAASLVSPSKDELKFNAKNRAELLGELFLLLKFDRSIKVKSIKRHEMIDRGDGIPEVINIDLPELSNQICDLEFVNGKEVNKNGDLFEEGQGEEDLNTWKSDKAVSNKLANLEMEVEYQSTSYSARSDIEVYSPDQMMWKWDINVPSQKIFALLTEDDPVGEKIANSLDKVEDGTFSLSMVNCRLTVYEDSFNLDLLTKLSQAQSNQTSRLVRDMVARLLV